MRDEGRRKSRVLLVLLLVVVVASGCRSTPPMPEESLGEAGIEEESREEEFERREEEDDRENDEEEQREASDLEASEFEEDIGEVVAPYVDARIQAAISRAEAGDRATALATLEDLVSEPEGGFLASYNLGVLKDRNGEQEEAIRRYQEALRRQPNFTPALTNLLRLLIRAGELARAEDLANEYLNQRPENLEHRAARLEVWNARGRYEDVIQGARDVLRRDVRHVDAMYQMATAMFRLGRLELSEAVLSRALQLAPRRGDLYFLLAMIALEEGDVDLARGHLVETIELDPRMPEARNHYGVLLLESGNFERAAEQLEAAIDAAPYFVEAWVNLGNVYKAQGEYRLAEDTFLDALDRDGENGDAHFNLGLLYLEAPVPGYEDIPRYRKAIESFQNYRQVVGAREASAGPVASHISEAAAAIEREEARQEQLRRAQMQGDGGSDQQGDDEEDHDE